MLQGFSSRIASYAARQKVCCFCWTQRQLLYWQQPTTG